MNITFVGLAAWLVVRFLRTGGPAMLWMMNALPSDMHVGHGSGRGEHGHAGHV